MLRKTIVVAALLLGACETGYNFTVDEQRIDQARLAQISTYAYATDNQMILSSERYPNFQAGAADRDVRAAIDAELQDRGWRKVEPTLADTRIVFSIGAEDGFDSVNIASYGLRGTYDPDRVVDMEYADGTLLIDMLDPESGTSIWRGWAVARLYRGGEYDRQPIVEQAVSDILAQLN